MLTSKGEKGYKNGEQRSLLNVAILFIMGSGTVPEKDWFVLALFLHCLLRTELKETTETTNNFGLIWKMGQLVPPYNFVRQEPTLQSLRDLCGFQIAHLLFYNVT